MRDPLKITHILAATSLIKFYFKIQSIPRSCKFLIFLIIQILVNSPYDFTAANAAYGTNTVSLGGGKYGIYSGDVTNGTTVGVQDGSITSADKKAIQDTLPSFRIGVYDVRDITGDSFVDEDDYRIMQNNVPLGITVSRP